MEKVVVLDLSHNQTFQVQMCLIFSEGKLSVFRTLFEDDNKYLENNISKIDDIPLKHLTVFSV